VSEPIKAVEFIAEVRQIRGMVDGSVNITLNLGEDMIEQAKVMLGWHHLAVRGLLEVKPKEEENGGKSKKIHF
jgi:hypothetical protein